eukprot:423998_1
MDHASTQNEYAVPLEYSFLFTTKPFGISFKNRGLNGAVTHTDTFVSDVEENSAAHGHIIKGSQVIKVQNQNVEGLHPADIMKIVLKYAEDVLPLSMTFRKPVRALKNDANLECKPRSIFLYIRGFYKLWRTLSSEILLNTLLICTSDEYSQLIGSDSTSPMRDDVPMANDTIFRSLLQWKNEQGLVLIGDDTFWQKFSDKLVAFIMDPSTYNTSAYTTLKLDIGQYKTLASFKYDVSVAAIKKELADAALNVDVIQEILYRSNVWLDVYDRDGVHINSDKQSSRHSSFDQEFDMLLEELSSIWKENDDANYIE